MEILDFEMDLEGRIRYSEPLRNHTSFRVGGPCYAWYVPASVSAVAACSELCRKSRIPFYVFGGGSNILADDGGYKGVVINMASPRLKSISAEGTFVRVSASVEIGNFLDFLAKKGLAGAEFLAGIPGTVGGAIRTNAGTFDISGSRRWRHLGEILEEMEILDEGSRIRRIKASEVRFSYKKGPEGDIIILNAVFSLRRGSGPAIKRRMKEYIARKRETQDTAFASAGCVFKNPEGCPHSAGELIDRCGLKGYRVGGASISLKHANFIINEGKATSGDIKTLMEAVAEKVKSEFGIKLETELNLV